MLWQHFFGWKVIYCKLKILQFPINKKRQFFDCLNQKKAKTLTFVLIFSSRITWLKINITIISSFNDRYKLILIRHIRALSLWGWLGLTPYRLIFRVFLFSSLFLQSIKINKNIIYKFNKYKFYYTIYWHIKIIFSHNIYYLFLNLSNKYFLFFITKKI